MAVQKIVIRQSQKAQISNLSNVLGVMKHSNSTGRTSVKYRSLLYMKRQNRRVAIWKPGIFEGFTKYRKCYDI